ERALSPAGLEKLARYSWPGNVRELENIMHRAVLLASGDAIAPEAITLPDMPGEASVPPAATAAKAGDAAVNKNELVGRTVESVERELILDTLNYCLGN